jgi:uncharacterized protein YegP (UPF0339 family)
MARKAKFEIYKSDKDGQWYVRLRAKNGEIVAVSEGYKRMASALKFRDKLFDWVDEAYQQPCEKVEG